MDCELTGRKSKDLSFIKWAGKKKGKWHNFCLIVAAHLSFEALGHMESVITDIEE